jgi:nucleoside 2-deoxyribosyltransferase
MKLEKKLLKGSRVYLVGPIDNVSREYAVSWRKDITSFCHSLGIGVFDPTNKPCDFAQEDENFPQKLNELKKQFDFETVSKYIKDIVRTDLTMVDLSDFVIAYLDMDTLMCGTYIELAHAAMGRKAVFLVCKQGVSYIPSFLFGLLKYNYFFSNFDQVKNRLKSINIGKEKNSDLISRLKFFDYDKVYNVDHLRGMPYGT